MENLLAQAAPVLTDPEWLLRGVALVEAALRPEPLLSAQGSFFMLISDLDGEMALSLVVAVLAVVARFGQDVDPGAIHEALDCVRREALQVIAQD